MVMCDRVHNTSKLFDENEDIAPEQNRITTCQRINPYSIYRYNAVTNDYLLRDKQDYQYKGQSHEDVSHGNRWLFCIIIRTQEEVELCNAEGKDADYRFCDYSFFVDQEIAAEQEVTEAPEHDSEEEQYEELFLLLPGTISVKDDNQRDIGYGC